MKDDFTQSEHDRQDMHSDLEHRIATRILKGKVMMPHHLSGHRSIFQWQLKALQLATDCRERDLQSFGFHCAGWN
jgi:hypothetical protein